MFGVIGQGQSRPLLGGIVLLSAVVGLAVGFLAALGWRFAVPRVYIDAAPPPTDGSPADIAYFQVFDYLRYVDGPSWWPSVALLPVVGVAVGALTGLFTRAVAGQRRRPDGIAVALAVTGLLTGVAGAFYAGQWTPQITVVGVSDPAYTAAPPSPGTSFDDTVVGAPPRWELGPPSVLFPAMGLVVGLACGTALLVLNRRRNS